MSAIIHFPTPEEEKAALGEFFAHQAALRQEGREAVKEALPALERLAEVLRERSGQPYKLRAMLYSMWNGKPWTLNDICCLDWAIRKDLVKVLLAWGYGDERVEFFYKAMEQAVQKAGQWKWFLEEQSNVELLAEYVEAARREK